MEVRDFCLSNWKVYTAVVAFDDMDVTGVYESNATDLSCCWARSEEGRLDKLIQFNISPCYSIKHNNRWVVHSSHLFLYNIMLQFNVNTSLPNPKSAAMGFTHWLPPPPAPPPPAPSPSTSPSPSPPPGRTLVHSTPASIDCLLLRAPVEYQDRLVLDIPFRSSATNKIPLLWERG